MSATPAPPPPTMTTIGPPSPQREAGTVQASAVDGPPWALTFTRDTTLDLLRIVGSWPVVALVLLLVFHGRIVRVLDALADRMKRAKGLKLWNVYEDGGLAETMEKVVAQLSENVTTPPITTTTTPAPQREETVRESIVSTMAEGAVEGFRRWKEAQEREGRRFVDDRYALLTWVLEVGTPVVFRSYEVFRLTHERAVPSLAAPDEKTFRVYVEAYDRDHPDEAAALRSAS